jgi:hypothetical protein
MFTEEETRAEILISSAAVDAVRQRIDALHEVQVYKAGATDLMAAMGEAETVLVAAEAALDGVYDVLCNVPAGPLRRDALQNKVCAGDQLCRARVAFARVAGALVGVAVDIAYDAERTQRRGDIDLARILLERGRAASQAIADMHLVGLTRPPKGWVRSCAKRLSALRRLEVMEGSMMSPKDRFNSLRHELALPHPQLARLLGKPFGTVQAWSAPSRPECIPPAEVLVAMEAELVGRAIERIRLAGFEVVPRRAA